MSNSWIQRLTRVAAAFASCCCGAAALAWAAPTVLAAWATLEHPTSAPERLVEHGVLVLAATLLASLLLWLSTSLLVCTVDALVAAGGPARGGFFRPRLVRALVAGALGTVATAGATGAVHAQTARDPGLPDALAGLRVPDRSYGAVHVHRVRAGESLWSITTDHLRVGAPTEAVTRRWPQLHRLNRDRIGADPHLIHPGTDLRLPVWGAAPTRGGDR